MVVVWSRASEEAGYAASKAANAECDHGPDASPQADSGRRWGDTEVSATRSVRIDASGTRVPLVFRMAWRVAEFLNIVAWGGVHP